MIFNCCYFGYKHVFIILIVFNLDSEESFDEDKVKISQINSYRARD